MTSQPVPRTGGNAPPAERPFDRTTAIGIITLIVAVLVLIGLIALVTILPAQTIAQNVDSQSREQQRILAVSTARQIENFFNTLASDLIGLSIRPEVRSSATNFRDQALAMLAQVGTSYEGDVRSIVRITNDGSPIYAWPPSDNQRILNNQPLAWKVDPDWVDNVVQRRTPRLFQIRLDSGGSTYVLAVPVTEGLSARDVLVMELDIKHYFDNTFQTLNTGKTGQLWIFDRFGLEFYHQKEDVVFRSDATRIIGSEQATTLDDYPNTGLQSVVTPVEASFTRSGTSSDRPFFVVLSRSVAESQEAVFSTLRSFGLFGVVTIIFVVLVGLLVGRFLLRETNRRRVEEQRRSTARTLLITSRALNSSLDLNIVLQRILAELGKVLPHDSASILLLNEDRDEVRIAADTAKPELESLDKAPTFPLNTLRGAREVVLTGRPVVINDTATDPRWRVKAGMPGTDTRSWLGVPLRVRDESVGVLNIDSYTPNRFLEDDIDLAEAFADQAGVAIQNARAHEVELKVYETELETARAIQTSLLPQEAPPVPEVKLAARSIPARQVSGDFYQYYVLPNGKLGVVVGDVSGKGIPAALLMAVITTSLRDEILRFPMAAGLLNELNTRLLDRMRQNNMNSALLVTIFDPTTHQIELANGGMVQPYLKNGDTWTNVEVGGYPLGASSRSDYRAKTANMAAGSLLVMVSDGVIESQNLNREFFGFEGLENLLNQLPSNVNAEEIADRIVAAVREHVQGQEPQDDITIVVMQSM